MTISAAYRMSHASRIAGFPAHPDHESLLGAAEFWSAGLELDLPRESQGDVYLRRCAIRGDWEVVPHRPPVPTIAHLDIETDDIEAEAARLEELGARRIGHLRQHWWELELPAGQRIRISSSDAVGDADDAFRWG